MNDEPWGSLMMVLLGVLLGCMVSFIAIAPTNTDVCLEMAKCMDWGLPMQACQELLEPSDTAVGMYITTGGACE